jgi:selenocysteine lyase/cysteine desulfurase
VSDPELSLDTETFRRLGYRVIDALADAWRAARVLGVTVHRVATDDALRLDVDALRAAVADDRARGRRPWCVVGTAGTTGTAAVDPLVALRRVCDADGMWLHVDGATAPRRRCARRAARCSRVWTRPTR